MGFVDWWIPKADLEAGETTRTTWLANHALTRLMTVGGKLELTDRRLVFRPGRVDRRLGARVWSVPLDAIIEVGRAPRTWNPLDGGLRVRLRVATRDGASYLFVVNRLDAVIQEIEAARVTLPHPPPQAPAR